MTRIAVSLVALAFCAVSFVHADYTVADRGTWPQAWPKELEPLRDQARTFEGPLAPHQHYAITFTSRDQFEAAWPHIVKVKSKESSLRLVRAPNFFLGQNKEGVVIHCRGDNPAAPNTPIDIELVVDGSIIDLNRIPLPPDTPINDERFKDGKGK